MNFADKVLSYQMYLKCVPNEETWQSLKKNLADIP